MANALRIRPEDNVVVALRELSPRAALELSEAGETGVITLEDIPFGHKVAIRRIAQGEAVIKYGASIGVATADIIPGQHVHTHNLRSVRGVVKP
jgi:altronate dehydratase